MYRDRTKVIPGTFVNHSSSNAAADAPSVHDTRFLELGGVAAHAIEEQ